MAMLLSSTGYLFAQAPAAVPAPAEEVIHSVYSDPIFYGLCIVALILLIYILQLQRVFASVAQGFGSGNGSKFLAVTIALGLSAIPETTMAASEPAGFLKHAFGSNALNALFFLILVELAVVLYYVRLIRTMTEKPYEDAPYMETVRTKPSFWEKFNQSVAVEKEAAILTDHDYDGIRELDNALPPWWKYGFYLTIVWAVFYLVYFHVTEVGPSSTDEYNAQVRQGEADVTAYLAKMGNQVNETNVVLLSDADEIVKGEEIFVNLCVACHGAAGEGLVGPNMTDTFWKHGGGIQDLFKVVKYGVAGTGMKSWKTDLSPSQMAAVCSFILTLQETNPPNGKAPEGQLYNAPTDSTMLPFVVPADAILTDTLKVAANI